MPMLDDSKIQIALKKVIGKAQTDNDKEGSNEALGTGFTVAAGTVFGEDINGAPDNSTLYNITSANVEFVRLVLSPDLSANGHAFLASLPADYETNSSNPKAGTGAFVNGQQVSLSNGKLQIVPPSYGTPYEGKPYRSGSAAQGSGDLVPPGDVSDWYLDYWNGVIFQENDPNTNPDDMLFLECFIYIGDMVTDALGGGLAALPISEAENLDVDTGAAEVIDAVPEVDARAVKWFISATKGTKQQSSEVFAGIGTGIVEHSHTDILQMGGADDNFCQVDVTSAGGNARLEVTTDDTDVEVKVTRVQTKR